MNLKSPRLLIVGHGRHGKDEFAKLLCHYGNFSFSSSSWCAAEFVFEALKSKYGYKSVAECFEDRHNHREEWMQLICDFNTPDKTKLAKLIYEKSNIYVGMRDNAEYLQGVADSLFNYIFYVDASRRVNYQDPTFTIPFDPIKMIRIDNNGSLKDLNWWAYMANEVILGKTNLTLTRT
jgi:hypothetical protein